MLAKGKKKFKKRAGYILKFIAKHKTLPFKQTEIGHHHHCQNRLLLQGHKRGDSWTLFGGLKYTFGLI